MEKPQNGDTFQSELNEWQKTRRRFIKMGIYMTPAILTMTGIERIYDRIIPKIGVEGDARVKIINYLEKCFTKGSSIVSRRIADEFILVPIRQKAGDLESIYTMNEVAGHIWELIDGERRVKEIRDAMVEEFEVSPEEAEVDIVEFLQQLEKIGAVREV